MLACELFDGFFFVTNWTAAWKGLDFSPAIKQPKCDEKGSSNLKLLVLGDGKLPYAPDRCKHSFTRKVPCNRLTPLSSYSFHSL